MKGDIAMKKLQMKKKLLIKKLGKCEDLVKGSISSVCSSCQRGKCICKIKSGKLLYRLTYKDENQVSKTVYIHKSKLPEIKKMIKNFEKARKIIDELITVNIQIFKAASKIDSEKNK